MVWPRKDSPRERKLGEKGSKSIISWIHFPLELTLDSKSGRWAQRASPCYGARLQATWVLCDLWYITLGGQGEDPKASGTRKRPASQPTVDAGCRQAVLSQLGKHSVKVRQPFPGPGRGQRNNEHRNPSLNLSLVTEHLSHARFGAGLSGMLGRGRDKSIPGLRVTGQSYASITAQPAGQGPEPGPQGRGATRAWDSSW